jgi:aminopeptidase N
MEHQSIIAYGNKFRPGKHGYDWLHHHELGHEWWGNLVTAPDWSDFWIHEGLCTYMQALYAEEREGVMAYHHALYENRRRIQNKHAVAPSAPVTMKTMEDTAESDAYAKGAWVIHMVRYLVGREDTLRLLRRFAYPTPAAEAAGDGSACRFATTADLVALASQIAGRDLSWLFNLYLHQPALPELESTFRDGELTLRWKTPDGYPFPMPVEVEAGGVRERVDMANGAAVLRGERYREAKVDPDFWILKQPRLIDVRGEPAGITR